LQQRYSLSWYVGRHETLAAGFWIYQRSLLEGLVELARSHPEEISEIAQLSLMAAGPEELFDEIKEITAELPFKVDICKLPLANFRHLGSLLDGFYLRYQPGVLHAMVNTLPVICPGRKVVTLHDIIQSYPPDLKQSFLSLLRRQYYRAMLWWIMNKSDLVYTGHETTRKQLRDRGFCVEKVSVLYPALDRCFLEQPVGERARGQDFKILAFASKDPRKNIELFLEVFAGFSKDNSSAVLTLVCAVPSVRDHYLSLVASKQLSTRVEVKSAVPREQLPQIYQDHDLIAFPSVAEGFGYPLYEAISQGRTVIADSNLPVGGFPEQAEPLLVRADCCAKEGIMEGLCTGSTRLIDLAARQKAAESVRELLSPAGQARTILSGYREVLFQDCNRVQRAI